MDGGSAEIGNVQTDDGDGAGEGARQSPTGRVPQWVLDEQERNNLPPAPPPPPRRLLRAARRGLAVLVLVPSLGLGTAVLTDPGSWSWAPTVEETLAQPSTPPPPPPAD